MENSLPQPEGKEASPKQGPESRSGPEQARPGIRVEQEPNVESRPEQEHTLDLRGREMHEQPMAAPQPPTAPAAPVATAFELEQLKAIETILAENLESVFRTLPPEQQAEFKREGEVTARTIVTLLSSVQVKVKRITDLIVRWLRRLPGISRFFVEQEAKIKTDKLLELRNRQQPDA
jgi:hypothetical protein